MKISTVAQMRTLDCEASENLGIPETILMENAGEAAYFIVLKETGVAGKRFVLFCGPGNNGGDGFVVARKLRSSGAEVVVFLLATPGQFRGAAKKNLDILTRLSVPITELTSPEPALAPTAQCDAVIDAIFGTGLSRPVEGLARDIIGLINTRARKVYSLDIPSGIHGDTGEEMGCAVQADTTITFGLPKIGNLLYPGYARCGKLYVTHISFPPQHYDRDSITTAVNLPPSLPPRDKTGHKGSFGDVLFIAGAAGYLGAPYFSAYSFLKAGGGYSRLAAPAAIAPYIAMKGSELVLLPQTETPEGTLALSNKADLLKTAADRDLVVIGPGLALNAETQQLVRDVAAECDRPLLIDGDGLTAIAAAPESLATRKAPTILTPHAGEMARLVKKGIADIAKDRIGTLKEAAQAFKAVIVLKGAHSLIGYPDGRVYVNLSGNPGMAKAGTGDVLNGVIAAMHGLGLPIPEAVCKGVFLHGVAGDLAARNLGEDGISAQDILEHLPLAVELDREGLPEDLASRYRGCEVI